MKNQAKDSGILQNILEPQILLVLQNHENER